MRSLRHGDGLVAGKHAVSPEFPLASRQTRLRQTGQTGQTASDCADWARLDRLDQTGSDWADCVRLGSQWTQSNATRALFISSKCS